MLGSIQGERLFIFNIIYLIVTKSHSKLVLDKDLTFQIKFHDLQIDERTPKVHVENAQKINLDD